MDGMTIEKAALACGGRLCGSGDMSRELGRAVIDSRAVEPGDLFVAYKGEKADGHDYISAAFDRGAACCLAERRPEGETRPLILTDDVQSALEQICAAYRRSLSLPVIGIIGSVGKTTAKEMIAAVLSRRFRVLKTEGNLNNQIGVPMTVSRIRPEHEAAVVEMGISDFGEMRELAQIAAPTAAVYTIIGYAHLENLHDLEGVLRAKTELLPFLPEDAPIFVNGDDEKLRGLRDSREIIRFGLRPDCEVRAEAVCQLADGNTACEIVSGARRIPVRIPAFGHHMVYAALAGAAVGLRFGLSDREITEGIAAYETVGRRAAVKQLESLTLIDDCYNSNPDSCRSGIDSLMAMPGRHVCILGDMLELGESGAELHREIGRYAAQRGVELLIGCGSLAREICRESGGLYYEKIKDLVTELPKLVRPGDTVLVKASRGMRFEEISEALKQLNREKTDA